MFELHVRNDKLMSVVYLVVPSVDSDSLLPQGHDKQRN